MSGRTRGQDRPRQHIVVTGIGVCCALGRSPEELLESIRAGRSGIGEIQSFDVEGLEVRHAAELRDAEPSADAPSGASPLDRTAQLAVIAARQALGRARLSDTVAPERIGLVMGVCAGGQGEPPRQVLSGAEPRPETFLGASHYAQGGQRAAVEGVLFISLLFACVLLHEFGHVFAARRYGVQTPDITLLPIGGVARLERIPEKPSEELVVALAGPAVNVVIAALLFLVLGGLPSMDDGTQVQNPGVGLLGRLAWVNITLVVFNLIPAFPMDGGRVLRALLAYRLGYTRGTRIAAGVGQAVAFALGLAGLFGGNPLLIFIALFVYMGAASEASAAQMRDAGRGMIASDAAETRFEGLSPTATVEDAVERLLRTSQHDFPVVDGGGGLRGVVTRDDMIRALREHGPDTPVPQLTQTGEADDDAGAVPYDRAEQEKRAAAAERARPGAARRNTRSRRPGRNRRPQQKMREHSGPDRLP